MGGQCLQSLVGPFKAALSELVLKLQTLHLNFNVKITLFLSSHYGTQKEGTGWNWHPTRPSTSARL
jgi:hypothetical protein